MDENNALPPETTAVSPDTEPTPEKPASPDVQPAPESAPTVPEAQTAQVQPVEAPAMSAEQPTEPELPLLEFVGVTKRYGSKKVLDELSFAIGRGGKIGLLGPNGSGKTTIIKLINGLLTPTSGEVLINGERPSHLTAEFISYLPERDSLPQGSRICDLVDLFADFYADFDRLKANDMIARLRLDPKARMRTLSKGNREKVQLILTMSRKAKLYVLDEPIGGVDPAARDFILDTILSNYDPEGSILISTHLIADIERVLDDVIFLSEGKAALCASVQAIHEKHGKTVDELFRELYKA